MPCCPRLHWDWQFWERGIYSSQEWSHTSHTSHTWEILRRCRKHSCPALSFTLHINASKWFKLYLKACWPFEPFSGWQVANRILRRLLKYATEIGIASLIQAKSRGWFPGQHCGSSCADNFSSGSFLGPFAAFTAFTDWAWSISTFWLWVENSILRWVHNSCSETFAGRSRCSNNQEAQWSSLQSSLNKCCKCCKHQHVVQFLCQGMHLLSDIVWKDGVSLGFLGRAEFSAILIRFCPRVHKLQHTTTYYNCANRSNPDRELRCRAFL